MTEIIFSILAGLGFYFLGVSGIRTNLQRIPGRHFREFVGRATKTPLLGATLGFMMGVVTQTSNGVSIILAGLISRGMATIPQALPVVAWSNFGLVVLIYLINQPLHIIALFLLGLSGLYLNFFQRGKWRGIFEPLFSLGMLLLGFRLMKINCAALASSHEAVLFFSYMPASDFLAFIFGALARTVIQSTSTVMVLGVILSASGIFSFDQALMVLFGTGLGTGMAAYFLTTHFHGVMRQITLFEAAINVAAAFTMVLLFTVEYLLGWPLVRYLPGNISMEGQLANCFLLQQSLCVAYAYATLPWMPAWLERAAPMTVEQDLSRPRFISDEATGDIETGLALAEQELCSLVQRLPGYLRTIRTDHNEQVTAAPVVLHNATLAVMTEIESFLTALSRHGDKSHSASLSLLRAQRHLGLVQEMEDSVWQIVQSFNGVPPTGQLQSVETNLIEALDTLLHTGIDALTTTSVEDIEILGLMTAAPGKVVDQLRRNYLRAEQNLAHQERILILSVLSQYERIVWILQQLSRSLEAISAVQPADSSSD